MKDSPPSCLSSCLSSCLRLAALSLVGLATVAPAPAQQKRPMTIVELVEVARVGSPRLSPDGTELLYTRTDADWKENGRTPTSAASGATAPVTCD